MENQHYLLSDVARILGQKPHRIVYTLTTRQVPEPTLRVANKRVFVAEDVERLARHFHVTPQWSGMDSTNSGMSDDSPTPHLSLKHPFQVLGGKDGVHEVCDGEGQIFARCDDRGKAMVLAGLLEAACQG